ncbi:MAG: hypothetical protein LBR26_09590 [Prevotella sp.]|jgi:flagellin-specific chaperone FliS|nr:hypothetical protein [Prevotella sp.]
MGTNNTAINEIDQHNLKELSNFLNNFPITEKDERIDDLNETAHRLALCLDGENGDDIKWGLIYLMELRDFINKLKF